MITATLVAPPIITGYPDYYAFMNKKQTEKRLTIGLGVMSAISFFLIIFILFRFFKNRAAPKKKTNHWYIGDRLNQSEKAVGLGDDDSMKQAKTLDPGELSISR